MVVCGDDSSTDDDGGTDGGTDAPVTCESASECDDGLFCNGPEDCVDSRCVPGADPCPGTCDDVTDECVEDCPDADGDGVQDAACGGTDCDDADPNRYPGNTEVCDDIHDEDCDPGTFGPDADGDGYQPSECCNGDECGRDCDDTSEGISPNAVDGCGGGDEDCDGDIDEEPDSVYYRDEDNDNYGLDDDTVMACSLPSGYAARGGDCSDDPVADINANEVNPGATEVCNDYDDDCDGTTDETVGGTPCACSPLGSTRTCGLTDPDLDGIGICQLGMQMCVDMAGTAGWGACAGATAPATESCNSADDDCDGMTDEGVLVMQWQDVDGDDFGAGAPMTACSLMGGYALVDGDCDDGDPDAYPGAPETCDGVDNDCDEVDDSLDADAVTECAGDNGTATGCNPTGGWSCEYTCDAGFLDCTALAGCETIESISNCGTCGRACAGSNTQCEAGSCRCADGWASCINEASGRFDEDCEMPESGLSETGGRDPACTECLGGYSDPCMWRPFPAPGMCRCN